jgi:hypothetical protein
MCQEHFSYSARGGERVPFTCMTINDYFIQAFARAQRRRSLWNLALIPLVLLFWCVIWWSLFRFVWRVHEFFYPQHTGLLQEFWPKGATIPTFLSSFLMVFGPAAPALGLSMLVANLIFWFIAPARQALESEALDYPCTDFTSTQKGIIQFTTAALAVGLLLGLIGAATLRSLQ